MFIKVQDVYLSKKFKLACVTPQKSGCVPAFWDCYLLLYPKQFLDVKLKKDALMTNWNVASEQCQNNLLLVGINYVWDRSSTDCLLSLKNIVSINYSYLFYVIYTNSYFH